MRPDIYFVCTKKLFYLSKWLNSISDYSKWFMELLFCDDKRWCKPDDVIVSRLGQQSIVS